MLGRTDPAMAELCECAVLNCLLTPPTMNSHARALKIGESHRRARAPRRVTKKQNGEGHEGLPRFCGKSVKTRRKKLEAHSQSELQLARIVALCADHAEVRHVVRRRAKSGIVEHRVIEDVVGDELELGV